MAQQMSISSQSEFFSEAKKHPDRFYIVHYSCQNLNDGNEGLSPRVTSIAVVFFANDQTVSFSTHSIAEEIGITCADVATRYDEVEKRLLESFYTFVRDRRDKYWSTGTRGILLTGSSISSTVFVRSRVRKPRLFQSNRELT